MLTHEIKNNITLRLVGSHHIHIFRWWYYLGPYSMVIADSQMPVHQTEIIRSDAEGDTVAAGLANGLLLLHGQFNEIEKRSGIPYNVLYLPGMVLPVIFIPFKIIQYALAVILAPGNNISIQTGRIFFEIFADGCTDLIQFLCADMRCFPALQSQKIRDTLFSLTAFKIYI